MSIVSDRFVPLTPSLTGYLLLLCIPTVLNLWQTQTTTLSCQAAVTHSPTVTLETARLSCPSPPKSSLAAPGLEPPPHPTIQTDLVLSKLLDCIPAGKDQDYSSMEERDFSSNNHRNKSWDSLLILFLLIFMSNLLNLSIIYFHYDL